MNGIINIVRFVAYSVGGLAVRKAWNWLIEDVDPIPGSKEFDNEYYHTKSKYIRLTKLKEEYETYRKSRRDNS
jgi:hypothetical protein